MKIYVVGSHLKRLNEMLQMNTTTDVFVMRQEKYIHFLVKTHLVWFPAWLSLSPVQLLNTCFAHLSEPIYIELGTGELIIVRCFWTLNYFLVGGDFVV